MIKAETFKELQKRRRKDCFEKQFEEQIKEIEHRITQAIEKDETSIIIPIVLSGRHLGCKSFLGIIAYSQEFDDFINLLSENGYTVSTLCDDVIISWGLQ